MQAKLAFSKDLIKVGNAEKVVAKVFEKKRASNIIIGDNINFLDMILTEENSFTKIKLLDNSYVNLGPNSELIIDDFVYDPNEGSVKGTFTLVSGFLNFVGSKKPKTLKFYTQGSILGIRGTDFDIFSNENGEISFAVYEGTVLLSNKNNEFFSIEKNSLVVLDKETQTPIRNIEQFNKLKESSRLIKEKASNAGFKFNDKLDKNIEQSRFNNLKVDKGIKSLGKLALKSDNKSKKDLRLSFINEVLKDKSKSLKNISKKDFSNFMDRAEKEMSSSLKNKRNSEKSQNSRKKNENRSFSETFKEERKRQGAGGTFKYKGKSYSTDLPSDKTRENTKSKTNSTNRTVKQEESSNKNNVTSAVKGSTNKQKNSGFIEQKKSFGTGSNCMGCAGGNADGSRNTDSFGRTQSSSSKTQGEGGKSSKNKGGGAKGGGKKK